MRAPEAMPVRPILIIAIALGLLAPLPRLRADLDEVTPADVAADIDWPMYRDPELQPLKLVRVYDQRMKAIWAAALARPDVETRRRAAYEVGVAAAQGMPGLGDLAAALIEQMKAADAHPVMVLAAAHALIHLDAKQAADSLVALNERGAASGVLRGDVVGGKNGGKPAGGNAGIELVLLTDPALAKWKNDDAAAMWMKRVTEKATPRPVLVSAMTQLAAVRHAAAAEALSDHAMRTGSKDVALRLHAARCLAALGAEVPLPPIDSAKAPMIERLIAATILASQPGDAAIDKLAAMAMDDEAAVASIALARLVERAPARLPAEQTARLVKHADPTIRLLAARLVAGRPSLEAVAALGPLLDDVSPQVRYYARDRMIEFGAAGPLSASVRELAMATLGRPSWRGIEQAAVIIGRIEHAPAAGDLVKLLPHARNEVRMAAIIALRRLAIRDAAMLDAILNHAKREADAFLAAIEAAKADDTRPFTVDVQRDRQLAQLLQLLGMLGHKPADAFMQRFIPKNSGFWAEARSAAIWGLGRLHANQPDAGLAAAFVDRLSDLDPNNPEMLGVRRMAAISLGRMKAVEVGMGPLQSFLKSEQTSQHIGGACRWAIMHITGRELPPLPPREVSESDFVIQPLRE